MKNGKLKLGKYIIEPKTKADVLQSDEFNIINMKNEKVYISKMPLELYGSKFWTSIYCKEAFIKKIDLCNADKKYKMSYKTMTGTALQELRKENDKFLLDNLGNPNKENISGLEYDYSWGKILSYFDNKSAQAGIVINYV
ncbi:hypothetical protein [Clostridium sp.]|uniref:hypothetical protein n=1 Tax=Clostridium sp. TaxID=1506 RepID=UPI001D915DB2|nr:hypothetical protein [Clostridium sp.]MBS5988020.1 hypothetical protein [Clostridium sp.]